MSLLCIAMMMMISILIYHTTSFSPPLTLPYLYYILFLIITYILAKTPALRGITQDIQEEFDSFVDVMEKRKDQKDLLAAYADVLDYYMYPEDSEDFSSEDFDSEDYDFEEKPKKGKKGGGGGRWGGYRGPQHVPHHARCTTIFDEKQCKSDGCTWHRNRGYFGGNCH